MTASLDTVQGMGVPLHQIGVGTGTLEVIPSVARNPGFSRVDTEINESRIVRFSFGFRGVFAAGV